MAAGLSVVYFFRGIFRRSMAIFIIRSFFRTLLRRFAMPSAAE